MKISKLAEGQKHKFAPSALRVELTGSMSEATVQALDVGGADATIGSRDKRLKASDLLLVPTPRRLRLTVVPSNGGAFPEGTDIGLTVFTHGGGPNAEQVIVMSFDVSALERREIGVLEFVGGAGVLTISRASKPEVVTAPTSHRAPEEVSTLTSPAARSRVKRLPPESEADLHWLRAGRYALRVARNSGAGSEATSSAWALVLDGSISMAERGRAGGLGEVLELVSGIVASWTGAYGVDCSLNGAARLSVEGAEMSPTQLQERLVETQPWSTSLLAPAIVAAAGTVGRGGTIVVVTDGVPGDVPQVAAFAITRPDIRILMVTMGRSQFGLEADTAGRAWWDEQLGGIQPLADLPSFRVAALAADSGGQINLAGDRPAQLAQRLTSAAAVSA